MKKANKMKLTVCAAVSVCACLLFGAGCKKTEAVKLTYPTNLAVENETLVWDSVANADGYEISIDGEKYFSEKNCLDVFDQTDSVKTYEIKVTALGDGKKYKDSRSSATLKYTVEDYTKLFEFTPIDNNTAYEISSTSQELIKGKVVIPDLHEDGKPITKIAKFGFLRCKNITGVILPDTVTVIGIKAFDHCQSVSRFRLPDSITEIQNGAFNYCIALSSVRVPKNVTLLNDGIFSNCEQLSEVSLSEGITEIKQAFHNCQSLEHFTLPSTVKKIEPFRECTALKEIYIPASVEEIGPQAFNGCNSLGKITVDENNPTYRSENNCILRKADNVLTVGCKSSKIPDNVTGIGERAFCNIWTLGKIDFPKTLQKIEPYAFWECRQAYFDALPCGLEEIGDYAFYNFSSLLEKPLAIPNSVKSIGTYAFFCDKSGITVFLPDSVETVEKYAFYYANIYTNITLENKNFLANLINPDTFPMQNNYKAVFNCTFGFDDGIPYVISFLYQHGDLSKNEYGATVLLPNSITTDFARFPFREGYTFLGWSTSENGEALILPNESPAIVFSHIRSSQYDDVVFYAVWKQNDSVEI